MNSDPDSRYQLVDRYLDGVTTNEDARALTEAVETDPDVLAYLCESAEIEAGLQKMLAPEPRAFAVPRILPFWHWRRGGKWLSAGAAAAALLTIAAVVLWPRGGTGGDEKTGTREPSLAVKRLKPGERSAPLQQPGMETDGEAMEEVEFRPGEALLQELRTLKLDYPNDKGIVPADEFLVRYLRAAGVTFPGTASARWLAEENTVRGPRAFVVTNTDWNLARVEEILNDPVRCGPRFLSLTCNTWKFAPGAPLPPQFAGDRILSAEERKLPRPEPVESWSTSPDNWILKSFGWLHKSGKGEELHSILQVANCRMGDLVLISGLFSTLPADASKNVNVHAANASLELEMALRDGQEAVVRVGRMPDGDEWIISIQAHVVPLPQILELKDVPGGLMKFDASLLTVKAGLPVRLVHRNEQCPLQHNFLLLKPGTLQTVGALADKMLSMSSAMSQRYLPQSPDIIVAGERLLGVKQREIIDFTAPAEPGDYPYCCTFPGHWRLQNGILRVVK